MISLLEIWYRRIVQVSGSVCPTSCLLHPKHPKHPKQCCVTFSARLRKRTMRDCHPCPAWFRLFSKATVYTVYGTTLHEPKLNLLSADLVQDTLEVDALGSLDGQTQCSVPDELCKWPKTTADAESGSVVECLLEAVVVEENARGRVDIGEWVLGLMRALVSVPNSDILSLTFPCSVSTPGATSEFFFTSWYTGLAATSGRASAKSIRAWKRGSGFLRTAWP